MKKIKIFVTIATIIMLSVAISSPVKGQSVDTPSASGLVMKQGNYYYINWSGFSSVIANVKIELYKGGLLYNTIISSTPNDGSYLWIVPSVTLGTDYYFRISGSWIFGSESDYSNYYFTIANPQVTTPTASNISWKPGSSYNINWTGFTGSSDVKIELYKNSTGVLASITSSTANDGTYLWTIPSSITQAADYLIKVTSTTNSTVSDLSDNYFAIAAPNITSPSDPITTSWRPGNSYTVNWTGFAATNVKIELLRGSTVTAVLVASTANDGSQVITIPASTVPATDYDIKVTSTANTGMSDVLNFWLTIAAPTITSPNAPNISWLPGSSHTVTWTGFLNATNVKIELFKGLSLYYTFTSSTANDGSEVITIPASTVPADNYDIRITSTTNTGMWDDLLYYFAIAAPNVITPSLDNICWRPGSSYYINWNGFAATNVIIELYKASTGVKTTITSSTANTGSYIWTIPSSITQASDYRIWITSTTNTGMYDYSNFPFAIAAPQVTAPTATCVIWRPGNTYGITWIGYIGTYVKIDLYKGSTLYAAIAASTPNDGAESWTVPASLPIGNDYKIRVTSTSNSGMTDDSDNAFNVALPSVTNPTASGIVWVAGNSYTVTWSGFTGSGVNIELYKISTATFTSLATSTPNDGAQSVTIPASVAPANDYRIKVTSTVCSNIYDYSDNDFAIAAPKVTAPSATCLIWAPGYTYSITWTGYVGTYVKIDLYKGSTLHTNIAASTPNDGTESWTVPASMPIGDDYRIRVTSTTFPVLTDESDYAFNIALPQVTSQNTSGLVLKAGNSYTVTWSGFAGSNVNIELYKSSTGLYTTLASSTPNDGTQLVTIPVSVTPATDYRIWISSAVCANIYDYNNFSITIDPPCILDLSATTLNFPTPAAGVLAVSITSNTTWTVSDDAAWLSATPASGTGNGTLIVNVEANSGSARTGIITVTGCSTTKTITVTQAASSTIVNLGNTTMYTSSATLGNRIAMPVTFTESGSIQSITIYHNGGTGNVLLGVYSDAATAPVALLGVSASTVINASAGWQTVPLSSAVSVTSGQTVWLSFVFQTNPGIRYIAGTPARALSTATWSGGMPATFGTATFANFKFSLYCTYIPGVVPKFLTVSPASISLGSASGTTGTFGITSNTTWSITDDAGWLDVSPLAGSNIATITVTANSANTGASARTATVTVAGTGVASQTVTVTQASGTTVNLGNTTMYTSSATLGNRVAMPVTFTEAGSIQSITIYHNGGTGNVLLGVYSDAATAPATQLGVSASTVINASAGWQTVPLTSAVSVASGQTVWLSFVFQTNPGIRYLAGTPARALSTATWSGGMPATFGTATFANFKFSLYCTYTTGAAPTLTVSPTSISLGSASGSNGTFSITSNTTWSITDDAGWLDVSPLSGSNNATITVTANSANTGASARTATVTIAGTGVTSKTVTVTQAAPSPTTVNLGNTTVYTSSATLGNRIAMPVTFTEAGSIQSITIYHNGGTGNVLLGVYSDVATAPATQLGVSASTTINASAGWQTVPLTSAVSVATGTTVWLSFVFQTNPGIRYLSGTPARALSTATWSGGMPATFGTATFANFKYSLYCTYTTGAAASSIAATTELPKSAEIATAITPEIELADLKVYPNPFSDRLRFEFVSPESVNARIDLYDMTGRLVKNIFEQPIEGGVSYEAEFRPETIINGMYIYRMTMGEAVYNGKVVFKKE